MLMFRNRLIYLDNKAQNSQALCLDLTKLQLDNSHQIIAQRIDPNRNPLVSEFDPSHPISLPGAGAMVHCMLRLSKVPVTVLAVFTVEGDNIPDAELVCAYLMQWMDTPVNGKERKLAVPPSWRHMYGQRPEVGILFQ
jgi:hypothetical protein